jgi:hypothetical protein
MHKRLKTSFEKYTELFKNIAGEEITPVDSLPKSAKVPFQNRIAFIVHYIRKTSAISHPV